MIDNSRRKYIGEMDEGGNPLGFGEAQHYTESSNGSSLHIDAYGTWKNDKLHGICHQYNMNGMVYEGECRNGERFGKGTLESYISELEEMTCNTVHTGDGQTKLNGEYTENRDCFYYKLKAQNVFKSNLKEEEYQLKLKLGGETT